MIGSHLWKLKANPPILFYFLLLYELLSESFMKDKIMTGYGKDLSNDIKAQYPIKRACEKAKKELSVQLKTSIQVSLPDADYRQEITRALFEDICDDLLEQARNLVKSTLDAASFNLAHIDEIIAVGGSSRIPKFQESLADLFNSDPSRPCHLGPMKLNKQLNADEAAVLGAALLASSLFSNVSDANNDIRKPFDDYCFVKELKVFDIFPTSICVTGGVMRQV